MNVQSMLALGALVMLSLVSIRFNSSVLENQTMEIENKVYLTAFSLADDLIEEIKVKAFDETTLTFPTNNPATLSPKSSFGKTLLEPIRNDVDDYHGYLDTISAPHAENYVVSCKVEYVEGNNPNNVSGIQTFYKRATVRVSSPFLRLPIYLSFIFTLK